MMENKTNVETTQTVQLPEGCFCGHNCADGCIYWNPYDRDSNGRQYCSHYRTHYYPSERQGCLSYEELCGHKRVGRLWCFGRFTAAIF